MEKIAELKFSFGEFIENKDFFDRPSYIIYLYAFLILFVFGIGVGLLRNIFSKPGQPEKLLDNSSIILETNKKVIEENFIEQNQKTLPTKLDEKVFKESLNYPLQVK